ncbi:MAG: DUF2089 domain-containing protein [Chthonomonadaceae bacterium]|nr:DUF2089 domain-containing protein [Chthonomonadaceae bacterium]
MEERELHDIPTHCPVTGGALYVSELTCANSGITIRGKFRLPRITRLSKEQKEFLEVFLKSKGVISTVEKELNLSYPTVRARLDSMLDSMGLVPYKESTRAKLKTNDERKAILDDLEKGLISPAEAKARLKGA